MAKNLKVHFSSKTGDWATPQDFFDKINKIHGPLELDVAADQKNSKCLAYFDGVYFGDGLKEEWVKVTNKCWMNPPYGREISKWVKKAYEESEKGCKVVALLPARTDTKYFHDYIYNKPGVTIEFIKGRLKFGGSKNAAPFPSMLVIFNITGVK